MAEHIVKLTGEDLPRAGDVEVIVASGPQKGARYSVRPKDHATCHGTGRIVRVVQNGKVTQGIPSVCDCIRRPVEREVGPKVELDARWLTPEQRQEARRSRLDGELRDAQTALEEALRKRDQAVQACVDGASSARARIVVTQQTEQACADALQEQVDTLAAERVRVRRVQDAFEAAKLALEHARLTVQATEKRLESRRKERENAQDTALKLDKEAERIRERSEHATRIEALRRAVAKIEAEIAKPAALPPAATTANAPVSPPAETPAAGAEAA